MILSAIYDKMGMDEKAEKAKIKGESLAKEQGLEIGKQKQKTRSNPKIKAGCILKFKSKLKLRLDFILSSIYNTQAYTALQP